jgi:hypothetical protein
MDTSTVLHQCIIAVKPEDEFAFFEHSWTHAIPRLPHLNRAAISWVAYISSFQLSNGVRACTAIVAVLSFPSDREPANVPGSPAGERQHHNNLNENTWPKEETSHGPFFRQSGAAGCWPAAPVLALTHYSHLSLPGASLFPHCRLNVQRRLGTCAATLKHHNT